MHIGSQYLGASDSFCCQFTLWAPLVGEAAVHLIAPEEKIIPLQKDEQGYWHATVNNVPPDSLYYYLLEGQTDRADPASHFQPQGVHGPSQVIAHKTFSWNDDQWQGIPLEKMVIYELHVGTFTKEGTFTAIIPRIPELLELGVNTIEIMPVAQFPGERNWGYDGTFPFAVQNSYGGVNGLKQLVDACHQQGMAVILDVVYNHLGPEGNYLWGFGTYFTDRYKTPWGSAVNFDAAYSDGVRNYFIENALYWLKNYHIDALRLDAIHAIYDFGAKHILAEIAGAVAQFSQQQGRKRYLIAESDLNDPRVIRPQKLGGYGIDAQWSDDFHHALHTVLTKETRGYYQDFGSLEQLAKAYRHSFVYAWDYSPHRRRYHGSDPSDRPSYQFVVCSQNHDQVGNRMLGDRTSSLISFEALKLTAAAVLLSPYIPLLFMGEEYGETAPFLYFVSHSDPNIIQGVREGRKAEFSAFFTDSNQQTPDPQAVETFERSRLHWEMRHQGKHQQLWSFYQKLLQLRREIPALTNLDRNHLKAAVIKTEKVLQLQRWCQNNQILAWLNFSPEPEEIAATLPPGSWKQLLDSAASTWGGNGSPLPDKLAAPAQKTIVLNPHSVVVYSSD